jgi:hypothetical protein
MARQCHNQRGREIDRQGRTRLFPSAQDALFFAEGVEFEGKRLRTPHGTVSTMSRQTRGDAFAPVTATVCRSSQARCVAIAGRCHGGARSTELNAAPLTLVSSSNHTSGVAGWRLFVVLGTTSVCSVRDSAPAPHCVDSTGGLIPQARFLSPAEIEAPPDRGVRSRAEHVAAGSGLRDAPRRRAERLGSFVAMATGAVTLPATSRLRRNHYDGLGTVEP